MSGDIDLTYISEEFLKTINVKYKKKKIESDRIQISSDKKTAANTKNV